MDEKEEFVRHQQEQMEELLLDANDDIESIKHTYHFDKTKVKIKLYRRIAMSK